MAKYDLSPYFARLKQYISYTDWSFVTKNEFGNIYSRSAGSGRTVVMNELVFDVSFSTCDDAWNPENVFRSNSLIESTYLSMVSPGDLYFKIKLLTPELDHALQLVFGGNIGQDGSIVRFVKWRDYPCVGQSAALFLVESERMAPYCVHLSPLTDGRACMRSYAEKPWPRYPHWSTPLTKAVMMVQTLMIQTFLADPIYPYTVLTLKSCPRGPPLIPCRGVDKEIIFDPNSVRYHVWEAPSREGFSFPLYMRALLSAAGCDIPVYDGCYGLKLAPYQALVVNAEWEPIKSVFFELFSVQQAAYRHMNGGKGTPKVQPAEPRFVDLQRDAQKSINMAVAEVKTFVEVFNPEERCGFQSLKVWSAEYH